MDVGIVTRAVPYILYLSNWKYFTKKVWALKICFGFNSLFVLYSVLYKGEWNGFALKFTNFIIFPSTYIACFKSAWVGSPTAIHHLSNSHWGIKYAWSYPITDMDCLQRINDFSLSIVLEYFRSILSFFLYTWQPRPRDGNLGKFWSQAYSSRLLTITHRASSLTRGENYGLREKKEKSNTWQKLSPIEQRSFQ